MLVGLIMLNGWMVCMELGVICKGKAVATACAAAHVAIPIERLLYVVDFVKGRQIKVLCERK